MSPLPMQSECMSFFFNDTATTEIYTLSLHDALPIWALAPSDPQARHNRQGARSQHEQARLPDDPPPRSEEHTSELQSRQYLVCRLLLEKKMNSLVIIINCLPATLTSFSTLPLSSHIS